MTTKLLLTAIAVGSVYVVTSLFLSGEISLFLYGFGWGIVATALSVLLSLKTFRVS
jgi:Na+/pantothenate symporter